MHEISIIINEQNQTVNARELWKSLKSKRSYSNWIKDKITGLFFKQGIDFIVLNEFVNDNTAFGGKRKIIEYHVSINMAKELCMMEKTEIGKKVRQYFIECEKRLFNKPALTEDEILIKAFSILDRKVKSLENKIEEDKPKVEFYENVANAKNTISIGDFAKLIGTGQNKLFKQLRQMKYLKSDNIPYQKYIDSGYFNIIEQAYDRGKIKYINLKPVITGKGQTYFNRILKGV